MKIRILILAIVCSFSAFGQSQLSWKKHVKLAEELYSSGKYADAAENYKAAWKQKVKKKELIYKAGECYAIIKDYKNTADAFKHVKDMNEEYPLVGLRYARALKQAGQYDEASRELVFFLNGYKGADMAVVKSVVENEIRGCELALKAMDQENSEISVSHIGSAINTSETEFAPFPFNDEVLYFSSTMAKRAEIYFSQKVDGEWTKASVPKSFPTIENDHFCNGTLTPDAKRFYFTLCKSEEMWGGLTTKCEINVIKRVGDTWSAPERLRDYINFENSTSTHPYVVHEGNTEILYFASNRTGGKGGMDIWYTTRDITSNDIDFTFPVNAGSKINTLGDEITPYYSIDEGNLYYSSNGQSTFGGYDIFVNQGAKTRWGTSTNVGMPLNTSADDFFFVKSPSGQKAFLVSNRLFGMEKIVTTHEDIFEVDLTGKPIVQQAPDMLVRGNVYDDASQTILNDVTVGVYEVLNSGKQVLVENRSFKSGIFEIGIEANKIYEVEAQKAGFLPASFTFSSNKEGVKEYGKPIFLKRSSDIVAVDTPSNTTMPTPKPETTLPKVEIEEPAMGEPVVTQPRVETSSTPEPIITEVEDVVEVAPEELPKVEEVIPAIEEELPVAETTPVVDRSRPTYVPPTETPKVETPVVVDRSRPTYVPPTTVEADSNAPSISSTASNGSNIGKPSEAKPSLPTSRETRPASTP